MHKEEIFKNFCEKLLTNAFYCVIINKLSIEVARE